MTLESKVLAWDSHKIVAGLNWLMGSQPSPLDKRTRILRVLHIAIHCPLPAAKIRGPKIL